MSKIGRKIIDVSGLQVDINGQNIIYKGPQASGTYVLPEDLVATLEDSSLALAPKKDVKKMRPKEQKNLNRIWGLHRALLTNALSGAKKEFELLLEITGLGYKAVSSGKKLVFTLGYSHKIDFELPEGVTVAIDKSGQKLTIKSANKTLAGQVGSHIKSLRRTEPYKGTGIKLSTDTIIRKAGKTKSAG